MNIYQQLISAEDISRNEHKCYNSTSTEQDLVLHKIISGIILKEGFEAVIKSVNTLNFKNLLSTFNSML